MAVITISRQLGSGGAIIARMMADELGYRVVDRDLVDAVAVRAGVSVQTARSLDEHALDWVGGLIQSIAHGIQGQQITQEAYCYAAKQVIKETAHEGNIIILGRAAQVVLGFQPGTFHVHVVAPTADRIANMGQFEQVDPDDAKRRIEASDAARRRYIMLAGRRDWTDPMLYDLIVNTHRLRPEKASAVIVAAARSAGVFDAPVRHHRS